jgi:hypothetical protein
MFYNYRMILLGCLNQGRCTWLRVSEAMKGWKTYREFLLSPKKCQLLGISVHTYVGVRISNGFKGNGRFDSWDPGQVRVVTLREHDDEILGSLRMRRNCWPEKQLQRTAKYCSVWSQLTGWFIGICKAYAKGTNSLRRSLVNRYSEALRSFVISVTVHWRTPRGGGCSNFPPPPKFQSFDKAEPNSQFRGKYTRNCLVFLPHHPN